MDKGALEQRTPTEFCVSRLKILADGTRLAVVEVLMRGPMLVSELGALLDIEQSLLSHHLKVMREAGLVRATRVGKGMRYALAPDLRESASGRAIDLGCCRISFNPSGARQP